MEHQLHEQGYDVFTAPAVHYSERRRIMEGQRVQNDLKQARQRRQVDSQTGSFESERRSRKEQAKANAVQQYKQERGLV